MTRAFIWLFLLIVCVLWVSLLYVPVSIESVEKVQTDCLERKQKPVNI